MYLVRLIYAIKHLLTYLLTYLLNIPDRYRVFTVSKVAAVGANNTDVSNGQRCRSIAVSNF